MKANELRIGNWVKLIDVDYPLCVYEIKEDSILVNPLAYYPKLINTIQPIPLTEEWLVRFGLERGIEIVKGVRLWENRVVGGNGWFEGYKVCIEGVDEAILIVEYVHQLQNLYFALTACELDKEYFEKAMKRIENHKAQLTLL